MRVLRGSLSLLIRKGFFQMVYRLMILTLLASLSIAQADFEPLNTIEATRRLTEGVQLGSVKQVQEAIARGADIHDRNTFGRTPLILAATKGNKKIIDVLLEAGANPNQTDDDSNSPLYFASRNCNHRAVISLLMPHNGAKADVNHVNHVGQSALHAASEQGCDLVVQVLLRQPEIKIHMRDDYHRTALDYATENADILGEFEAKDLIMSADRSLNILKPAVH